MSRISKERIAINGRFLTRRITGVERYGIEILKELDQIIEPEKMVILVPSEAKQMPEFKNIKVKSLGILQNRLWEHITFALYAVRNKMVTLNFCNVAPLLSPGIVCIHDVKFKAKPEFFSKKFIAWYNILFNNATKRSKEIITVSNFSKKEIMKYYNVPVEKVSVIPSSWTHFSNTGYDDDALVKYGVKNKNYYFSMSSLEPNKNFKWIAEVAKRNPNEIFAVAGSINNTVFANGLGFVCPENMKLLGYVSDKEAKSLMRYCKAFLFPTFYEGFGLPPLEALSAGAKAIIISDTEVMHEIYGNNAVYINPNDYDIILEEHLSEYGSMDSILKKYTWKSSAIELNLLLKKYY
jgi:glycosyltransferase involved in cell wall biosynthesis